MIRVMSQLQNKESFMKQSLTRKVFKNPIYFLAFGFGSGLSPIAPRHIWHHCRDSTLLVACAIP
jgi:hypothetical protein